MFTKFYLSLLRLITANGCMLNLPVILYILFYYRNIDEISGNGILCWTPTFALGRHMGIAGSYSGIWRRHLVSSICQLKEYE